MKNGVIILQHIAQKILPTIKEHFCSSSVNGNHDHLLVGIFFGTTSSGLDRITLKLSSKGYPPGDLCKLEAAEAPRCRNG